MAKNTATNMSAAKSPRTGGPASKAAANMAASAKVSKHAAKTASSYATPRKAPIARSLTAEEANKVIVTIAIRGDGDVAWVDYENGDYLTAPIVDFSKGEEIVFDDPKWDLHSLVDVTTYALLRLRKNDGSLVACYIKTPRWW